jgi:hypothetical protein
VSEAGSSLGTDQGRLPSILRLATPEQYDFLVVERRRERALLAALVDSTVHESGRALSMRPVENA